MVTPVPFTPVPVWPTPLRWISSIGIVTRVASPSTAPAGPSSPSMSSVTVILRTSRSSMMNFLPEPWEGWGLGAGSLAPPLTFSMFLRISP